MQKKSPAIAAGPYIIVAWVKVPGNIGPEAF